MALKTDEYVLLKGKPHPLYRGVLREAIENGLTRLVVQLIQFPSPDNGNMAVCSATAVFEGADGKERMFTEVGDCDNHNCGSMIAPHKIRMAATRAKGRALRDALGIGDALAEEIGGDFGDEKSQRKEYREPDARPSDPPRGGPPVTANEGTQRNCRDCGCDITIGQLQMSVKHWGAAYCLECRKKHPRLEQEA